MTTAMFKSLDCPSFKEMEKLEVKFDGKSISFWYKPHPLSEARVAFMLVQLFTPHKLRHGSRYEDRISQPQHGSY